ncbi:MAG: hypothetical protein H6732_11290 [Alphaproteobacteria bacterium]|nr:hypothetical protein [Alphaproteobacteria bacterium]
MISLLPMLLAGCGGGLLPDLPAAPEAQATELARGSGWAVTVPSGAQVRATGAELAVDAPDGSSWFDVRWLAPRTTHVPLADVTRWAEERCRPVRWDQPATPAPGVWTVGGGCTLGGRRHWVLAVVEERDPPLLIGMMASRDRVAYEDLWVQWWATAMSLAAGEAPAAVPDAPHVREALRGARLSGPVGDLPVAGGGVFSGRASEALAEAWAAHLAQPVPPRFDP